MIQKHAVLEDWMLERARSRIGQVWLPTEPYFNTQATKDTIRHFVNGIGDMNPLYRNEEYAKKTRYEQIPAPPFWLFSVFWPVAQGAELPGLHGLLGGNDWTWYKPVLEGDEISYSCVVTDVVEKKRSRMADRMIVGHDETTFKNQRGEVVAKAKAWNHFFERGSAGRKGKLRNIERAKYTPEQMQKIIDDYDKEVIRGATPRYWEDVEVGEELPFIVKGPLSLRDIFSFIMGTGSPFMKAHRIFYEYRKRHPAVGMVDSQTGIIDVPELVHMEDTRSQEIGIARAFDYFCQRMSWLGNLITHWAGDDSFVKRHYIELREVNFVGDTTWCHGKVTKKYFDENGEPCVDIDTWGINQREVTHMLGRATIILPSREKGTSPLKSRLPK